MSFRSKDRTVRIPTNTRRSSSTSRTPSSSNTNYMSSTRPHNLNLYSSPGTTSLSASSSFNTHHPRSTSTSYSSLPQSPSYKSPASSGYGSYGSSYGLGSSYGSYGSGLHGSLNSLNSLAGYGSKRNSYKRNGGYSKNGYSTFTLAFESPKHYQPKPTAASSSGGGNQATPVPPQRMSRSRNRHERMKDGEGGKRSHSLNSLAGSEGYASGSERSSRSRLGSSTSLVDDDNDVLLQENGSGEVIDYKALWESAKLDNARLQEQLKKRNEELRDARAAIDRVANATNKGSLSELEKREKRAMERKLSEMEEELKQLQKLKHENERLRAENRALTRVVSKLTANANK